jgi:hypothetical protein
MTIKRSMGLLSIPMSMRGRGESGTLQSTLEAQGLVAHRFILIGEVKRANIVGQLIAILSRVVLGTAWNASKLWN